VYDKDSVFEEEKLDEWDRVYIPDEHKTFDFSLEYLAQFGDLINACGQVSYFLNMKKCLDAQVRKAINVAASYNHDKRYYAEQLDEWRWKAKRSLGILKFKAQKAGVEFDISKFGDDNGFLNMPAISKDRRKNYKGYLDRSHTLSPVELEARYQKLLQKRMKR